MSIIIIMQRKVSSSGGSFGLTQLNTIRKHYGERVCKRPIGGGSRGFNNNCKPDKEAVEKLPNWKALGLDKHCKHSGKHSG